MSGPNKSINLEALAVLRELQEEGGPDIVGEIIQMFVEQAGESLKKMHMAISLQQMGTLSQLAHSLKSSSANLGAETMSAICLQLEQMGKANARLDEVVVVFNRLEEECRSALDELAAQRWASPERIGA